MGDVFASAHHCHHRLEDSLVSAASGTAGSPWRGSTAGRPTGPGQAVGAVVGTTKSTEMWPQILGTGGVYSLSLPLSAAQAVGSYCQFMAHELGGMTSQSPQSDYGACLVITLKTAARLQNALTRTSRSIRRNGWHFHYRWPEQDGSLNL